MYCETVTSFKDDNYACGSTGAKPTKVPYSRSKVMEFDKYGSMILGFSTDDMYEVMADPWLIESKTRYY